MSCMLVQDFFDALQEGNRYCSPYAAAIKRESMRFGPGPNRW